MNTIIEASQDHPNYLVDNHANLVIESGDSRWTFNPAAALELIYFLERTGYQAHAKSMVKGGTH